MRYSKGKINVKAEVLGVKHIYYNKYDSKQIFSKHCFPYSVGQKYIMTDAEACCIYKCFLIYTFY